MKIAIIGTSPIMALIALKLSKKYDVKIFEPRRNIGGAWSTKEYKKNLFIPRQTNVVIPASLREEAQLVKINLLLKNKFQVKIKKTKDFDFIQKFKPKYIYFYDLNNLFKKIQNNIVREKISNIFIKKNKFFLNGKRFDKVLVPYFNSINFIKYRMKKIYFDYNLSRSKHLTCILKKKKQKKLIYHEYRDRVFDRYLIDEKRNFFVGRIAREYKKKTFNKLIADTEIPRIKKDIIYKNYFYFDHYKKNQEDIKKLEKIKQKNLLIINTLQLSHSLIKFKKLWEI